MHLLLSMLKNRNRLCPRVNTDASKILRPRNFQKRPQSARLKSAAAFRVRQCGAVFSPRSFSFSTNTPTSDTPKRFVGTSPVEKFRTYEHILEESGGKDPGRGTATVERGVLWLSSPGVLFPSFPFQRSLMRRRFPRRAYALAEPITAKNAARPTIGDGRRVAVR